MYSYGLIHNALLHFLKSQPKLQVILCTYLVEYENLDVTDPD